MNFSEEKEFKEIMLKYEFAKKKLETEIEKLENRVKFLEQELLKKEIEQLKSLRNNLKPKEKQIKDSDIEYIKELRNKGLSYREISKKTSWSKATICRVLNGMYD